MTKTLDERLQSARLVMDQIGALLGKSAGALPVSVGEQFRRSLDAASGIEYWRELLSARAAALTFLDALETRVDPDDLVEVFATPTGAPPIKLKFSHVRLVGVEAYLSLTWSLADRITAMVGRVLCTLQGGALNEQSPVKLLSHFVQEERGKEGVGSTDDPRKDGDGRNRRRSTAAMVSDSIRQTFGFPIGISYAIRNHFIHDGAQQQEVEFFENRASAAGFKISEKGWTHIERKTSGYGVTRDYMRASAATAWPTSPRDDFRIVLAACEREVDDALGILLGSACNALSFHIGFMLGAD